MFKKLSRTALIAAPAAALLAAALPASAFEGGVVAPANFTAKLTIGDQGRSCSAVLVDRSWVMTAADCVNSQSDGVPAQRIVVAFGEGDTAAAEVTEVVVHPNRGVALARLSAETVGRNVPRISETGVVPGGFVNQAGFGRTATEWAPTKHSAGFTVGQVDAAGFDITPKDTGMVCKGDAGGPAFRSYTVGTVTNWELLGINTRSWQGGCLGAPATETRKDAYDVRVDGLAQWVKSVTTVWKAETLVKGDGKLYQGIRLNDGSWTGYTDVEAAAGSIGGVRVAAAAGINSSTRVVAVANDGKVFYSERSTGGRWSQFAQLPAVTNAPTTISQISMVSIGADLHVAAVANGRIYHALRKADGTWSAFGDVFGAAGSLPTVASVSVANVGGVLHVAAAAGGKPYHTIRAATGHWGTWGDVSQAAGATGAVNAVAIAGAGNDAHFVVLSDNGTRQHHSIRFASGSWAAFGNLSGYLGGPVTATSVGAAVVNSELQLLFSLNDNRVLHTLRKTDGNWAAVQSVDLTGVPGTHGSVAITGTL